MAFPTECAKGTPQGVFLLAKEEFGCSASQTAFATLAARLAPVNACPSAESTN